MSTESAEKVEAQDGACLKTRRCHFFLSKKGCKLGDQCNFLHEARPNGDGALKKNKPKDKKALENQTPSSETESKGAPSSGEGTPNSHEEVQNPSDEPCKERHQNKRGKQGKKDQGDKQDASEVCHYFYRKGKCHFGSRCRFAHVAKTRNVFEPKKKSSSEGRPAAPLSNDSVGAYEVPAESKKKEEQRRGTETDEKPKVQEQNPKKSQRKNSKPRVCRFFKSGHCNQGTRCQFLHPEDEVKKAEDEESKDGTPISDSTKPVNIPAKVSAYPKYIPPNKNPNQMKIESMSEQEREELRDVEIKQLKRRYPKFEELVEGRSFGITFVPTDPDWPFDFKETLLVVSFSRQYPLKALRVNVPGQENLPKAVEKMIRKKSMEWLMQRHEAFEKDGKVEMSFRPFLRWLDRNIEDMFTEGLKQYKRELLALESGLKIVGIPSMGNEFPDDISEDDDEEEDGDDNAESFDSQDYESSEEEESEEEPDKVVSLPGGTGPSNVIRRGTEIKLAKLQLMDNASTLMVQKLVLVLQCNRCKHRTEIVTPPNRPNSVSCPKCSFQMMASFRAAMAHQYTSVVGYLDLQECKAFDLIISNCDFVVGCFHCSKEMKVQNVQPGQVKETSCPSCHKKIKLFTENAQMVELQPSEITSGTVHVIEVKKIKKIPKDPAIKEGSPLPKNGTCKHYKKSYRWLRFPCCGMTYPCDICHDEKEDGHEMKFANRMICGFCCKEQPYSAERPCSGCGSDVTRKFSAHWEGGKGCRNVVKMARNDNQKYAGCSKTISNKAKSKTTSGKKKTKLRHT